LGRQLYDGDHPVFAILDEKLVRDVCRNVDGVSLFDGVSRAAFDGGTADFIGAILLPPDHFATDQNRPFTLVNKDHVCNLLVNLGTGVPISINEVNGRDERHAGIVRLGIHTGFHVRRQFPDLLRAPEDRIGRIRGLPSLSAALRSLREEKNGTQKKRRSDEECANHRRIVDAVLS